MTSYIMYGILENLAKGGPLTSFLGVGGGSDGLDMALNTSIICCVNVTVLVGSESRKKKA